MLVALMLPVMAQQVEVISLSRMFDEPWEPAYFPVLNQTGERLVYQTDDSGMKMYDLTNDQIATITTDKVAGNDVCWGGDGKVYFVSSEADETSGTNSVTGSSACSRMRFIKGSGSSTQATTTSSTPGNAGGFANCSFRVTIRSRLPRRASAAR